MADTPAPPRSSGEFEIGNLLDSAEDIEIPASAGNAGGAPRPTPAAEKPAARQPKPSGMPPAPAVRLKQKTSAQQNSARQNSGQPNSSQPHSPQSNPTKKIPKQAASSSAVSSPAVSRPATSDQAGERATRKRTREDRRGGRSALQIAIEQALKIPVTPPSSAEIETKNLRDSKKQAANDSKILKKCRKILELHEDDPARTAVQAIQEALLELGTLSSESAAELIMNYLEDSRAAVRETAARALGESKQPIAFEALIKRLNHDSSEMRASVVQGLGLLGDRRAVEPLVVLAAEDMQFNLRVLEALNKIGEPALPRLIELAGEAELAQMLVAVMALGRLKNPKALEVLVHLVAHPTATIRSHVMESIGALEEPKAIRYLVRGLQDPNTGVKLQAAIGLKKLGDHRASEALVRALQDPDQDFQEYVVEALGTCGDQEALPALLPLLQSERLELSLAVVEALSRLGGAETAPALWQVLSRAELSDGQRRQVKLKVLEAVRRLKPAPPQPELLVLLQDPAAEIREKAVDLVGHLGDVSAVVEIENRLKEDKEESVRAAAAKALGELKDPESLPVLEAALDDTMPVRLKAIIALGQLGQISATLALTPILRDLLPEFRYHAAQALAEIGDERSIRAVEVLAIDPDPMVSRGAFKALQKLGDERSEKEIVLAARKRSKKATTIRSANFSWRGLFSWAPIRDWLWPQDLKTRAILYGSVVGITGCLVVAFYLFSEKQATHLVRAYPVSASFSTDGAQILNGRSRGIVERWSLNGKQPEQFFPVDLGQVSSAIMVGPNHYWITLGNRILRFQAGKKISIAEQELAYIRAEMSRDRSHLAFYDRQGNVVVYNANTGQSLGALAFPKTTQVTFSETGKFFAVAVSQEVKVFDLQGKEQMNLPLEAPYHALAFSADDSRLMVNHGPKGKLTLVTLADQSLTPIAEEQQVTCGQIEFVKQDQQVLLFGCRLGDQMGIGRWNQGTQTLEMLPGSPGELPKAVDPTGVRALFFELDQSPLELYELESGQKTRLDYQPRT